MYNNTHVIAGYDKTTNDTVIISLKSIVKCITPILSNYTDLWLDFKRTFDETVDTSADGRNLTGNQTSGYHLLQPEIQSVLYVSAILIFFTVIFALTIICKYNTNYGDLAENNLFFSSPKSLTNSIESLNCEKKTRAIYERRDELVWFRRFFSRRSKADTTFLDESCNQEVKCLNSNEINADKARKITASVSNMQHASIICLQKNYSSELALKVQARKDLLKRPEFETMSVNTNKTIWIRLRGEFVWESFCLLSSLYSDI